MSKEELQEKIILLKEEMWGIQNKLNKDQIKDRESSRKRVNELMSRIHELQCELIRVQVKEVISSGKYTG